MSFPSSGKMGFYRNPIRVLLLILSKFLRLTWFFGLFRKWFDCSTQSTPITTKSTTFAVAPSSIRFSPINSELNVGEKAYDSSHFHGNVERILIDDHTVPPIKRVQLLSRLLINQSSYCT